MDGEEDGIIAFMNGSEETMCKESMEEKYTEERRQGRRGDEE